MENRRLPILTTVAEKSFSGPMFSEITEDGVRWEDGTPMRADVILWCTGFRSSLDHLAPLMLRSAPAMEAEPILVIPLGGMVTLTREGAENGYVTVDYGGVRGWAYADLLG